MTTEPVRARIESFPVAVAGRFTIARGSRTEQKVIAV
jgi:hypothetical protein